MADDKSGTSTAGQSSGAKSLSCSEVGKTMGLVWEGACCVSNEGPGGIAGCGVKVFEPKVSGAEMDMFSAAKASSVESALLVFSAASTKPPTRPPELPTEAGFPPSPSILLIPNAHLSSIGLEPKDEDGDGKGCEPVMNTDSERGV
jgi:hypothetical protein